jgi:hypothetical protein
MIDLGSIAGLHAHDHQLHAHCAPCDRWSILDLEAMVRRGQGGRRLPIRVCCSKCGAPGDLQVRPPMPQWTNTSGWIAAPR